ncbi:MAG TPA: HAMP domain-containing sensor histidine kinase [Solirubrobacteraceae bacterium]|nr:HAMP domain-containing sensor histidine kinase [Solirubrobacteraceae bacterium]
MSRRIAIAGVLAVCATALLVGVLAYVLVARDARSFEDRLLRQTAAHPRLLLGPAASDHQLAALRTPSGALLGETQALTALGTLPVLAPGFATVTLHGRYLRVLTRRLPDGQRLSVAVSDAPARANLARLRRDVAIAMLAAALAVSVLLIWLTRRALAPVRQTAAVAETIVATGALNARVPEPRGRDEVAQLTRSINAMLDHLESSDTALRRFIGDASHELRSPLTTLTGNLELLARGDMDAADSAAALADARAEAARLGTLVETLLGLARADTVAPQDQVDLADLVEALAPGHGAGLGPVEVLGDRVSLEAMLRNLLDNAERYGGGGELGLSADEHTATLTVRDHGPGVDSAEREAIFARFRRGRAGEGRPGSGLGLAIVAATARAHGGTVQVQDTPGGGATFVVTLPRADV